MFCTVCGVVHVNDLCIIICYKYSLMGAGMRLLHARVWLCEDFLLIDLYTQV